MRIRGWLIVLLLAVAFGGCRRQLPGARNADNGQDSVAVEDVLLHLRQLDEAEKTVLAFVKTDTAVWTQHELGWWYRYAHKSDAHDEGNGLPVVKDTCCQIHESVCDLNGTFLLDAIRTLDVGVIGKSEPLAYRVMVSGLTGNDTILMLIPWPAAYGKEGTHAIPPYTNISVRLSLHTDTYTEVELSDDTKANNTL